MKRHAAASCSCGWSLIREGGFTAREARDEWQKHRRLECPETRIVRFHYGACGAVYLAGFSTALDCIRPQGHEGSHRSYGGSEWDD